MFCYQCQETAKNSGCTINGVCGKNEEISNLQDIIIFLLRGISMVTTKMRETNSKEIIVPNYVDRFICTALFSTITNANFNKDYFFNTIHKIIEMRDKMLEVANKHGITNSEILYNVVDKNVGLSLTWNGKNLKDLTDIIKKIGVLRTENEDIRSLRELITYGLKGIAAYAKHAYELNHEDETIYEFIQSTLAKLNTDIQKNELLQLVLGTGEIGVKVMELLDKANTFTYGNPEITKVNLSVRNKPGILISGHDLKDLEDLLKQTENTDVDIYTHCEMLPANYYPALKKYKNFVGNYGGSWWKQREEFTSFNGPILFTSNCIVPPLENAPYANKVFTTGAAGFEGFPHIPDRKEGAMKDFSEIIKLAKSCNPPKELEKGEIIGGFAHNQVINLTDKIVESVKNGSIKQFIVMSGCDGRMKNREYYTEFAKKLPKDTIILTSGCAKFRYNKLQLGDINGIPRVLDAGQCNDSYSWIVIAFKLKEIFKVKDVNDLPIKFNIAWYEQKAVIVLLALLALGFKNIHIGPTMPAFISKNIGNFLKEKFELRDVMDMPN